jgi:hypothetical protein
MWGDGGLRESERGRHVEVERARELLLRRLHEALRHRAADVVDDDVDAAELVHRLRGEGLEVRGHGGIALDDERATAELADLGGDRFELVAAARREGDVGAAFGEGEGGRAADAAARAGYESHLVVDSEAVEDCHGPILTARSGSAQAAAAGPARDPVRWPGRDRAG